MTLVEDMFIVKRFDLNWVVVKLFNLYNWLDRSWLAVFDFFILFFLFFIFESRSLDLFWYIIWVGGWLGVLEFITSECGGIMVEVHYIKPLYFYIVMTKILFWLLLKKYRCCCGWCMQWICDKWWKYHFCRVSIEKRIHNKYFSFKLISTQHLIKKFDETN